MSGKGAEEVEFGGGRGGAGEGGEAFTQLCCRHQNDIALKVLNMQWHEPLY